MVIRPPAAQVVERRHRDLWPVEAEFGAGLAQRVGRLLAHRPGEDRLVVKECLLELAEQQAFIGKRRTGGDRIGDRQVIHELAVLLFGIERIDDTPAGLLPPRRAHPLRNQLDQDLGDHADAGQEQNEIAPGVEAAGLRRMHDEGDIDHHEHDRKRHGVLPRHISMGTVAAL
jgi:hypothetical protein